MKSSISFIQLSRLYKNNYNNSLGAAKLLQSLLLFSLVYVVFSIMTVVIGIAKMQVAMALDFYAVLISYVASLLLYFKFIFLSFPKKQGAVSIFVGLVTGCFLVVLNSMSMLVLIIAEAADVSYFNMFHLKGQGGLTFSKYYSLLADLIESESKISKSLGALLIFNAVLVAFPIINVSLFIKSGRRQYFHTYLTLIEANYEGATSKVQ